MPPLFRPEALAVTPLRACLVVAVLWGCITLPGLGRNEFKGEEGRRVLPAVTMLETGNWWTPYIGGEVYKNKPPMINWMVAASFAVTGVQNEWTARLPSVLSVLALVLLWVALPCAWFDRPTRLLIAIVFLTTVGLIEKSRLIELEAVYIAFTGLALVWWLHHFSRNSNPWLLWIGSYLFLTVGLLTKGPPHLLIFALMIILVAAHLGRLRRLVCLPHLAGLLLMGGLAWGWWHMATRDVPAQELQSRMWGEFIVRFIQYWDLKVWAGQVVKAMLLFMPWMLFMPHILGRKWLSKFPAEHQPVLKALRWTVVVSFALFLLFPAARSRYPMPVFPLAAVLVAWTLSVTAAEPRRDRIWLRILAGFFLVLPAAAVATVVWIPDALVSGVVFLAAWSAGLFVFLRQRPIAPEPKSLVTVGGFVVLFAGLFFGLMGTEIVNLKQRRRSAAALVNERVPDGQTVHVYKPGYQAFLFYVGPDLEYVTRPEQIDASVRFLLIGKEDMEGMIEGGRLPERPETAVEIPPELKIQGDFRLLDLKPEAP